MGSQKARRFMSAVIAVLLLAYIGYQFYKTHYSAYKTETASYFTANDSISASGVALRKEKIVNYTGDGVIDYILSTGDQVAKGGKIASIYSNETQAAAQRKLEDTESEISKLENLQSAGIAYAADIDSVTGRINDTLTGILKSSVSGDFLGASKKRDDILYLINEKQMISGKVNNFSSRIATLESQSKTLKAEAGSPDKVVTSPEAGYFVKDVDGLESAFDFSKINEITSSQIKNLRNEKTNSSVPSGTVGKICGEYDWYFVCTVPAGRAEEFRQLMSDGKTIQLNFPFVSSKEIPATVAVVNQDSDNSEAAVALECSYMDKELAPIRDETAQIIISKYSGIKISKDSVHFKEVSKIHKDKKGKTVTDKRNVIGVYVFNGSSINFRQVFPEFSTDSYIICNPDPPENNIFTGSTISLNDEVITEGTDLYDGKVIK